MTREEIRELVTANVDNRSDKDSVINSAINLALVEIGQLHDFRSMRRESDISIVLNDLAVDLPTDTHQLIEARLIDGLQSYPFLVKTKTWITERWPNIDADSTGKPWTGYVESNKVFLVPKSNGSYTLRVTYSALPAALDDDADEITVAGLDMAVVCWATSYLWSSLGSADLASVWMAKFQSSLAIAIAADRRRLAERIVAEPHAIYRREPQSSQPWLDPFVGLRRCW